MKKGTIFGFSAYVLWGVFPVYFKWLQEVPPTQIIPHRIIWSFVLVMLIITARRELRQLWKSFSIKRMMVYLGAGILLSINWFTFVWAVNNGYVVEASLGYFINPLVSVLMGVIFLREKLSLAKWVAVALAAIGVAYLTFSYGQLPWISLILAFSFGSYGLVKKLSPLNALHGLGMETFAVLLPASVYLLYVAWQGSGAFIHAGPKISLLLVFVGVITAVPLLLFSAAAQLIPLSHLGLLQYIAPTMQFFIGVFLYHEPFTRDRLIGFVIIWIALFIYSVEGTIKNRRKTHPPEAHAKML